MPRPRRVLIVSVLLALAGCSTIASRIREKQAVFNALPPTAQTEIRQGQIAIGFTPDMVYMAIGSPDETRARVDPDGREAVWNYNTYFDRYDGTVYAGHRRWIVWDPRLRAYRVFIEPVYANVYEPVKETCIRVTFRDGKVTAIDQTTS